MQFIGVIPARGGSKGIPLKSIAPCAGRPLLAYTCDAALGCGSLSRVLLSTDSPEIAEVGISLGIEVPFMRPASLAADETPMIGVLQHLLEHDTGLHAGPFAVVLLQPTSPLRTAADITGATELFTARRADSVVSVMRVPHQFTPVSVMHMNADGVLAPYAGSAESILRRQDKPRVYARNGPAVLVTTPELIRAGKLYGDRNLGYEMGRTASLDVDDPEDLALAELIIRGREHRGGPALR